MMKDNGNGKNDGSNRSTEVQSKDNGIRKSMMVEFAMAKCHQSRNVTRFDRDTPSKAPNHNATTSIAVAIASTITRELFLIF